MTKSRNFALSQHAKNKIKEMNDRVSGVKKAIPAITGNRVGKVKVNNRPGYIYVRSNERTMQVYNSKVANVAGIEVWIGETKEQPGIIQVLGLQNKTIYSGVPNLQYAGVQSHRQMHEWPLGQDIPYIDLRQIKNFRLSPLQNFRVAIDKGIYWDGSKFIHVPRSEFELADKIPSSGSARLSLFTISNSGSPKVSHGSIVAKSSLTMADLPDIPDDTGLVVGAIRLFAGQDKITESGVRTDLGDFRLSWPTLTHIQSSGSTVATRNTFNFTGTAPIVTDDASNNRVNINVTGGSAAVNVHLRSSGSPSYTSIQSYVDFAQSASIWSGANITDAGSGAIDVSSAVMMLKQSDSDIANIAWVDFDGQDDYEMSAGLNWIAIDYNDGSPILAKNTNPLAFDLHTQAIIGKAFRHSDDSLSILTTGQYFADYARKHCQRDFEEKGLYRVSGLIITESGTLNIDMTSGVAYCATNRFTLDALDTSVSDTFTYWYRDGAGGWTQSTGQTAITPNNYDDGDGVLGTILPSRYSVHWVYIDFAGDLHVQYGQGSYTLSEAENSQPPDPPSFLSDFAIFIGRIICDYDATTFLQIDTAFEFNFLYSTPADHGELSGLQGGTTDEYYHLTLSDYEALTDFNGETEKVTPISGDILLIEDSADSYAKKKIQIGNLPSSGSGGGSPGGSDGYVQYNDGGSFGGEAELYWDDVSNRLGIGTTSPDGRLHVNQAGDAYIYLESGINANLWMKCASGADNFIRFSEAGSEEWRLDVDGSRFQITESGSGDRLYVAAGGNVGIGESSPAALLDVNGSFQLQTGGSVSGITSGSALTGSCLNLVRECDIKSYVDANAGGGSEPVSVYLTVKNTSGGSVSAHGVGYIDPAGEFKTTTTEAYDGAWCVVVDGGADNADIKVQVRGRATVKLNANNSIGDYIITSTTAGQAKPESGMQPSVFGVTLTANSSGAGGTCSVLLLTGTRFSSISVDDKIYNVNNHSGTIFSAKINSGGTGGLTATNVPYDNVSGNEDSINVVETTQLGKIRLYNSTRGTYRLITACDTSNNTITTVSSADSWADNDDITAQSQVNTQTFASTVYFDIDLSQSSDIPETARAALLWYRRRDNTSGSFGYYHPYESYVNAKNYLVQTVVNSRVAQNSAPMPLFSKRFCVNLVSSGAATVDDWIYLLGFWEAVP